MIEFRLFFSPIIRFDWNLYRPCGFAYGRKLKSLILRIIAKLADLSCCVWIWLFLVFSFELLLHIQKFHQELIARLIRGLPELVHFFSTIDRLLIVRLSTICFDEFWQRAVHFEYEGLAGTRGRESWKILTGIKNSLDHAQPPRWVSTTCTWKFFPPIHPGQPFANKFHSIFLINSSFH